MTEKALSGRKVNIYRYIQFLWACLEDYFFPLVIFDESYFCFIISVSVDSSDDNFCDSPF